MKASRELARSAMYYGGRAATWRAGVVALAAVVVMAAIAGLVGGAVFGGVAFVVGVVTVLVMVVALGYFTGRIMAGEVPVDE